MVLSAPFFFTVAAALSTAIISIIILKVKPVILSESLSDFSDVTIGKSILFALSMITLFWGVNSVENSFIEQIKWSVLFYIMLLAAWIDLEKRIIPNGIIVLGLLTWVVYFITERSFTGLYLGASLLLAFLVINEFSLRVFKKKGLGSGDLKICIVLTLLCGLDGLWFISLSVLFGGIFGGIAILTRFIDRNEYLPFAPFLLAGTATGYFGVSWQYASSVLYGY